MINRKELQTLLRCHAAGDKTIFYRPSTGEYAASQSRILPEVKAHYEERPIEQQLLLEIYGEFPLSESNRRDWELRVKKAFYFPV